MVPSNCFIYQYANFNPRIKVLLFLDSAQGGLLKNVQNHFSRHLGSQEMAETQKKHLSLKHPVWNPIFHKGRQHWPPHIQLNLKTTKILFKLNFLLFQVCT